jgi:hypothetical protein
MRETCEACGESKPIGGNCPFCALLQKKSQGSNSSKSSKLTENLSAKSEVIRDGPPKAKKIGGTDSTVIQQNNVPVNSSGLVEQAETDERICPFCAETIKIAAVKCKHCGEFLKDSKKPVAIEQQSIAESSGTHSPEIKSSRVRPGKRLFLISALVVVAIVGAYALKQWTDKGSINGSAWLTSSAGDSNILRGLEISLCKEDVASQTAKIEGTVNEFKAIASPTTISCSLFSFLSRKLTKLVKPYVVATTKASVDGKYTFPQVENGTYYIFAYSQTNLSFAVWLQQVDVRNGQLKNLDLNNSNAWVINADTSLPSSIERRVLEQIINWTNGGEGP